MIEKAGQILRNRQGPGEKGIRMQDGGPRRLRVSRIWPKLILLEAEDVYHLSPLPHTVASATVLTLSPPHKCSMPL